MEYTYTWQFARHFEPLLGWLRESGFFEAHVYITVMTIPAVALFVWVIRRRRRNKLIGSGARVSRFLWNSLYFYVCWVAMTSLAVAFKTMIVEELDYQERQWFEPYLPGIHFYITSAGIAYIALTVRSSFRFPDLLLASYVQIALVLGYIVAGYRALNEDLAGAAGGIILFLAFTSCNYDLIRSARRKVKGQSAKASAGDGRSSGIATSHTT